ncbi:MAG: LysR family transcriptional regulator [Desulfobacteraceae bacterium]|nr:LysR family transcriptional regulator [Desulfobacteraceae bacterium]
MDLYHLKTFFTLAKAESFTKAAELLFVTQSAVSHAIKKLEASLDTALFLRRGKTLILSEAGQALFRSCEKIFNELEKADQELALYRKKAKFHVTIGSPVEFGTTILINHIKDFLETNPDIHLDFLFSHHLLKPLIQDAVDMAIDCHDLSKPGFETIPLFREQYVTIASPDFISENKIRHIDDLNRVNILSNDKHLAWWNNFIIAIPEEKRSCLKNIVRINHVRGIINGAIAGLGIGFVPKYTVMKELKGKVLIDPFPQIKPAADHFKIFIKKEKLDLKKNKKLVDYLTRIKPSEFGAR